MKSLLRSWKSFTVQHLHMKAPCIMGGRLIFGKYGNLFLSTGERSDIETRPQAQDLNSGLGKIIRITTDGKAVDGNPFEEESGGRPEIYSYGHRNVQGIAFHPETGDLWETEFGPGGGDELNRIEPGRNYGWPVITYDTQESPLARLFSRKKELSSLFIIGTR